MEAVKRIGRYLLAHPRLIWHFRRQDMPRALDAVSDSDWAGCLSTRKSTSCTVLKFGRHVLQVSSSTQTVQALSSPEAEFYALVKSASRLIGAVNMLADWAISLHAKLHTDSTGARGIASRRGSGKVRHIETPTLWLQALVSRKRIEVLKTKGATNIADLGAKYLSGPEISKIIEAMQMSVTRDKSEFALQVQA